MTVATVENQAGVELTQSPLAVEGRRGCRTRRFYPTDVREGDWDRKYRFIDKHGNLGTTVLGADIFNLFNVPTALVQQLNEEVQRIVDAGKEWATKWQDYIIGWELYPREGTMQNHFHLQLIVTQKGVEYNKQLAEALAALDTHLYENTGCSLIRVAVLMVPDVSEEEIATIWT